MSESNDSTWRGVPMSDLYGSHSPWGTPEFPLITPSYNHTVLYNISDGTKDCPPSPRHGNDKWDKDYVRMPCSKHSLYPVVMEDGESTLKQRWGIIQNALNTPMRDSEELALAILTYNTKFKKLWKFKALHKLFNEYLEEEESTYFFNITLPEIAKLALLLPKLIQSPIPLLRKHRNRSISLSQQQIACLLANAFFCTFPRRNTTKADSEYASYPFINFNMLYETIGPAHVLEKLKCICHYFRRVCTKVPVGVMTFMRRTVQPENCPDWKKSDKFIGRTPLHVDSCGTIEDGAGLIQVDFANKYLGGGVLRHGCVQEEIRFVICPELLLSMLFTEVLDDTEVLFILGCERYSNYTGYGDSFRWSGNHVDSTPFDSSLRRRCAVLAIDAKPFRRKQNQYLKCAILRELNKAWVGFSTWVCDSDPGTAFPGVGSGNWGCGAFGGSANLKSLLQIMACTEAKRPLAYYTFGDTSLRNDIIDIYNLLSIHNITVGQLYNNLLRYTPPEGKINTKTKDTSLNDFLRDAITRKEHVTKIKPKECKPLLQLQSKEPKPDDQTKYSPDLFEDEEMDYSYNDNIQTNKTVQIEQHTPKIKSHRPSLLFDEMSKIDAASGMDNINKHVSILMSEDCINDTNGTNKFTNQNNMSQNYINMAQNDLNIAENDVNMVKNEVIIAKNDVNTAKNDVNMVENDINISPNDNNESQVDTIVPHNDSTGSHKELVENITFAEEQVQKPRKITDYFGKKPS